MLLNTIKGIYLLVVVWLVASCGSNTPPTPIPTPTSLPTPTPIPGYIDGEEESAYTSFLAYYENEVYDCYFDPDQYVEVEVDKDYLGKAIYVGDGIWRFYVQVWTRNGYVVDNGFVFDDWIAEKEILDVQSKSDRTWESICTRFTGEEYLEERDYEPNYDPGDMEEPEEPPDQEWP